MVILFFWFEIGFGDNVDMTKLDLSIENVSGVNEARDVYLPSFNVNKFKYENLSIVLPVLEFMKGCFLFSSTLYCSIFMIRVQCSNRNTYLYGGKAREWEQRAMFFKLWFLE